MFRAAKEIIKKILPKSILNLYYLNRTDGLEHSTKLPLTSNNSEKINYKIDFDKVFKENLFEGKDSVSGAGSTLDQTVVLREQLPEILKILKTKNLLDIPCGDFNWMQNVELNDIKYVGADIVEDLVIRNNNLFKNKNRLFVKADLVNGPLPEADTIFCRDCLVHLNFKQCFRAIKTIKLSGARYLLTTTFSERHDNVDLNAGIWRTLNLQVSPFNFPNPEYLINEKCTEADCKFSDKCIGVWEINNLPDLK
jgi:hypothetical protein